VSIVTSRPTAVLFGYALFGCTALAALQRAGIHVVMVMTHADRPDENCWWPSLERTAIADGIVVVCDADLTPGSSISVRIAELKPDFIISSFFRDMLGDHVLNMARRGAWNLHPSLLPAYRGRAPINWQLVHGQRRTGLTLHRMVRRADAGGIIAQEAIDIAPDQDAYGLTCQLLELAHPMLDRAFAELVAGTAIERTQMLTQGSVFGRRRPEDGRIDWRHSARQIHNLVRAVAPPWPGAFTGDSTARLIIARTRVVEENGHHGEPGTVLPGNVVVCGTGLLGVVTAITAGALISTLSLGRIPGSSCLSPAEVIA
jgi:methionyl-tRNA formyltransferase